MTGTCAICGFRDPIKWAEIDGKRYRACGRCVADVPAPPDLGPMRNAEHKQRLINLIRRTPGLTFHEIRARLGIPNYDADRHEYDRATATIRRLVQIGIVIRKGEYPLHTYWPFTVERRAP